ncbi:MAG: dNTP triphosphohydrolase [Planctomycetes bacterium]|nr:dNTP triphosphohydrolase [Planctomycetota bacterium]
MNRLQKEDWELQHLHRAACKSAKSHGRSHEERPDDWRTRFERDRDRIIHCSAFRRLMYKTQVFINHVGDNLRTRMTHSLEVHQVSRSLASALGLNEPLCEAIALAHDLGHPPYGHSGEVALDKCMKEYGGFDHNQQSLRVVNTLERRSPEYRGLNLTVEVQSCLRKHEKAADPVTGEMLRFPLLEAQLVDLADSTAYHYHDVDDGIREGILDPEQMAKDLELWDLAVGAAAERHPDMVRNHMFWQRVANELLGITIADVREESVRRLTEHAPENARAAQSASQRLIGHSSKFKSMVADLHSYLYEHMYFREEINWHVRRSTDLLVHLYEHLDVNPTAVPERFSETADTPQRAACDFLAGMTDRYVDKFARECGVLPSY